uniref:Uncharacterized protein n=1 Tax=Romanomermis culicivorax TaxID=13658 RepID=A0A915IUC7_ROMCU
MKKLHSGVPNINLDVVCKTFVLSIYLFWAKNLEEGSPKNILPLTGEQQKIGNLLFKCMRQRDGSYKLNLTHCLMDDEMVPIDTGIIGADNIVRQCTFDKYFRKVRYPVGCYDTVQQTVIGFSVDGTFGSVQMKSLLRLKDVSNETKEAIGLYMADYHKSRNDCGSYMLKMEAERQKDSPCLLDKKGEIEVDNIKHRYLIAA